MPIYEYLCKQCESQFELLQKVSDVTVTQCIHCNNVSVKRLVSAASFRLKGSGWYETDFKGNNSKKVENKTDADKSKVSKPTSEPKKEVTD